MDTWRADGQMGNHPLSSTSDVQNDNMAAKITIEINKISRQRNSVKIAISP